MRRLRLARLQRGMGVTSTVKVHFEPAALLHCPLRATLPLVPMVPHMGFDSFARREDAAVSLLVLCGQRLKRFSRQHGGRSGVEVCHPTYDLQVFETPPNAHPPLTYELRVFHFRRELPLSPPLCTHIIIPLRPPVPPAHPPPPAHGSNHPTSTRRRARGGERRTRCR